MFQLPTQKYVHFAYNCKYINNFFQFSVLFIMACAVATGCCVSDEPCQREKAIFDYTYDFWKLVAVLLEPTDSLAGATNATRTNNIALTAFSPQTTVTYEQWHFCNRTNIKMSWLKQDNTY